MFALVPHLKDLERFLSHEFQDLLPSQSVVKIPAMALCWSQATFNSHACFGKDSDHARMQEKDRRSMYETLDELLRHDATVDRLPPLEVVVADGKIFSSDNRRLMVLKALQGIRQDRTVWVNGRVASHYHGLRRSQRPATASRFDCQSMELHIAWVQH